MKSFLTFTLLFGSLFGDEAELLFNGNCVTCHHTTKSISAPSMRDVRQRYKDAFSTKEDFVKYMALFVTKPSTEGSIMQDKIQKYKLMPLLGYEKSVVDEIASYIYDTKF